MDLSSTLTAQLSALSSCFDDPVTDLRAILDVLVDDLANSVPSFLGMTVTQQFDGCTVTINALDAELTRKTCTSLALPLDLEAADNGHSSVVLYASEAGAFVHLAADHQRVNGMDPRVVLDGPLPTPMPQSGVDGLSDLSEVNRAVGVLITRGYFPDEARAELRRRVSRGPDSMPEVARRVLRSTNAPPPDAAAPARTAVPTRTAGRRSERPTTHPGRRRR